MKLLVVLLGCYGDELLGGLGDVVRALDDLLGDQLHVLPRGPAAVGGPRLATLALQTVGAGGQQAQRTPHSLRARLLHSGESSNRRSRLQAITFFIFCIVCTIMIY